jgi:arylsulfatase A-like enzyme
MNPVRSKRWAIALFAAAMMAGTLGGHRSAAAPAPAPDDPANILLIVTDDQRADLMSMMPATRRLFARQGAEYNNFFVTTPLCCPSRASIMTGRYAHNHGVLTNVDAAELDHTSTLQHHLQSAGYSTGIFGKFLNTFPSMKKNPPYFDDWALHKGAAFFGGNWNVNGKIKALPKTVYATAYLRSRTESFLHGAERHDAQPWFVLLAPSAPHMPARAENRYRAVDVPEWPGNPAVFEQNLSDKPLRFRAGSVSFEDGATIREKQYRSLISVDDLIRETFSTLDRLDETSNTLAVFLSDNGYLWGEHGLGGKSLPYTPAIQVPMMLRWPRRVSPGQIIEKLSANIDIAPTIIDAAGVEGDFEFDGRSLFDSSVPPRGALLIEFWNSVYAGDRRPAWASIRTPTHQYTEYYEVEGADAVVTFRELYRHMPDPFQLTNVLGDDTLDNDPDLFSQLELSQTLAGYRSCEGETCP